MKTCSRHFVGRNFQRFSDLANSISMFVDDEAQLIAEDSKKSVKKMIEIEKSHTYVSSQGDYLEIMKSLNEM
jgi:hypothetical protein